MCNRWFLSLVVGIVVATSRVSWQHGKGIAKSGPEQPYESMTYIKNVSGNTLKR